MSKPPLFGTEELVESPFAFPVAHMVASALVEHISNLLRFLQSQTAKLKGWIKTMPAPSASLKQKIQDGTTVDAQLLLEGELQLLRNKMRHYLSFAGGVQQLMQLYKSYDGQLDDLRFKPSVKKKSPEVACVPTHCQLPTFCVAEQDETHQVRPLRITNNPDENPASAI